MGQFPVFRFGDFVLDRSQRRLLRSGKDVYLPPKTFDLLLHLLQNRGRVLTKDELLEAVWPDVNVVENTLAQRIREIRAALGDGAHGGCSSRRFLKLAISSLESSTTSRPASWRRQPSQAWRRQDRAYCRPARLWNRRSREQTSPTPAAGRDRVHDAGRTDRYRVLRSDGTTGEPPASPAAITSIAVLPFKPLVPEGRDAALELGMADSLITKLGSLRQITVRPLSAVRRYTDVEQDAVKAGRELHVDSGTGRSHPKAAGSDQSERKSSSCSRWTAAMGRSLR